MKFVPKMTFNKMNRDTKQFFILFFFFNINRSSKIDQVNKNRSSKLS